MLSLTARISCSAWSVLVKLLVQNLICKIADNRKNDSDYARDVALRHKDIGIGNSLRQRTRDKQKVIVWVL